MIRIKSIIFDFLLILIPSVSAFVSYYEFQTDIILSSLATLAYFYVLFWYIILLFELKIFKNSTFGQKYYGLCYVVENYHGISYVGKNIVVRRLVFTTLLALQVIGYIYLNSIIILLSLIIMASPSGKNEDGVLVLLIDLVTGLKVNKNINAENYAEEL